MNHALRSLPIFDFSNLQDSTSMLRWLHPDPLDKIIEDIHTHFAEFPLPCQLSSFNVHGFPDWLTLLTPEIDEAYAEFQSKVGLAFEFKANVTLRDNSHFCIYGVYTWIGCNILETEDVIDKTWLDETARLSHYGIDGFLSNRLHAFSH